MTLKPALVQIACGSVAAFVVCKITERHYRKLENEIVPVSLTDYLTPGITMQREAALKCERLIAEDPILSFYLDPNISTDEKLARLKKVCEDNNK